MDKEFHTPPLPEADLDKMLSLFEKHKREQITKQAMQSEMQTILRGNQELVQQFLARNNNNQIPQEFENEMNRIPKGLMDSVMGSLGGGGSQVSVLNG